jgi:DNA-binding NarL/FixJ family response regulator
VRVIGSARDESAAVDWLRREGQDCDLVIVDLFLRQGSGLGVLRAAQSMRVSGQCVVLTNYATPDMREACVKLGADRVFDKSGELEDLIAYCERLAEGDTPSQRPD